MIYTTESEDNDRLGFRWIPERNEIQMKRAKKLNTAEESRDLLTAAQQHPWTWCYLKEGKRP